MLHTGLGPDQAMSGFMTQVIACALQLGGMPVPKGGGVALVEALAAIVRDGGRRAPDRCRRRAHRRRGRPRDRRPAGRRRDASSAARAVLACVTPTQLYGTLLAEGEVPPGVRDAARRFRYGRGEMQIHVAMSERPRWRGDERLARTPIVHVTPGLDGVSRAVNEAERGLLPAEATIVVRPAARGRPSRAPEGSWILWIQLQELPPAPQRRRGRRARRVGGLDGRRCGRRTPTASSSGSAATSRTSASATIGRVVLSPADMEARESELGRR